MGNLGNAEAKDVKALIKPFNLRATEEKDGDFALIHAFGLAAWDACRGLASMDSILFSEARDITKNLQGLPDTTRSMMSAWRNWCKNEAVSNKNTNGWGPAHFACALHSKGALMSMHVLGYNLAAPAHNVTGKEPYSAALPVHICASHGFIDGIRSLSKMGYDLDTPDVAGKSSLEEALQNDEVR